jgi:hypothetical protein
LEVLKNSLVADMVKVVGVEKNCIVDVELEKHWAADSGQSGVQIGFTIKAPSTIHNAPHGAQSAHDAANPISPEQIAHAYCAALQSHQDSIAKEVLRPNINPAAVQCEKATGLDLDVGVVHIGVRKSAVVVKLHPKKGTWVQDNTVDPLHQHVGVKHFIYFPGYGIFDNTDEEPMEELCAKLKMPVGHKRRFKAGVRGLRERKPLEDWTTLGTPFLPFTKL